MQGDIWVFVEIREDNVLERCYEIISEGRRIANQWGENVNAVVFSPEKISAIDSLTSYGVNSIYFVDNSMLPKRFPELCVNVLEYLVKKYQPRIFLFLATQDGAEISKRLAGKLSVGFANHVVKIITSKDGACSVIRSCNQGDIFMESTFSSDTPYICVVEPGYMKKEAFLTDEATNTFNIDVNSIIQSHNNEVEFLEHINADPRTVDLCEADFIVAGGRGVGSKEGFRLIWELADALGAAVGGTRVAVDNGWLIKERQIGQSGKKVAPTLLISAGISGAMAHVVGIRGSREVIAINRQKGAAIFKTASLGILGDLHQIIPKLIEKIHTLKKTLETTNGKQKEN